MTSELEGQGAVTVEPFKQELMDTKRSGSTTRLDSSQIKGVKRKSLDTPGGQGSATGHYHMSSATIGEIIDDPKRRNGVNGDGYISRSEKRLKLKSSITSGTKHCSNLFGGRDPKEDRIGQRMMDLGKAEKGQTQMEDGKSIRRTEDKKGKPITALNDEFKKKPDAEDRWTGSHHGYLGRGFDRSRMTHRRERDTAYRTNGQQSKEHLEEDGAGITQKIKVDFQHSTTDFHKGKNPTLTDRDAGRDTNLEEDDLSPGREPITKSRSREDSKAKRDAPKRSRQEADGVREWGAEVSYEGRDIIREYKGLPRERTDHFRSGEFEEEKSKGRWEKKEVGEEDRKHGDTRQHGKHSSHNWRKENGNKYHRCEEDGFKKMGPSRRYQFNRSPGTNEKPRSLKEGYFKGNVEHNVPSVANTYKQNARVIAFNHWRDDQYDQGVGQKSSKKANHHKTLPRDRRKIDKMGTKVTCVENGLDLIQSSKYRNSSKDNEDSSSKGTRGTDQLGKVETEVARHEAASQISKAVGDSKRSCSSKGLTHNQVDEQDVLGVIDKNGGYGKQVCISKLEIGSHRNSTYLDNICNLPNLEPEKSFSEEDRGGGIEGSRQLVAEANLGPKTATEDMLQQRKSISLILETIKRKDCDETSEVRENVKEAAVHKSEKSVIQEGQEVTRGLSNKCKAGCKDGFQIEGTANEKSSCTNKDVQEQMMSDSKTPSKSNEELHVKCAKYLIKKTKMSSESLLRYQVVNVDRPKYKVSSREHRRQKHRGRSHSLSPKKHNHISSPKAHGKSTSPGRSERYRSDWDKFERDRRKTLPPFDSRYRRFGGGTSGLGGYSPRRRRSDAAVKTPSPPPRSPDRKKEKAWDSVPPGMDSSMIAAISAAHQAAVQHALATLATVNPSVPTSMLISPSVTPSLVNHLTTMPANLLSSLQSQINPAVTAVTLKQATRPLRRLYVGNVPSTVSDGELLEFINAAMLSANANHLKGTKPCINCSVNMEKNHAFAEFITPEDATAALAFDGVTLHGTTLKIRRPKDFVQPAIIAIVVQNGGIESLSAVPDMVSSCVVDSPHKVFVGGIPSPLTAGKVKEIVSAFGQLKAYHWEVDDKKQPPQAFAFLEYLDPTATLTACAGLNGMRLGTGFLTVVQATPDADTKSASNRAPFYGIPEHAKSLLEPPSCVLELHNLVAAEDIPNMSKEDIEELIEDVQLECTRFGNVKSAHMVYQRLYPELETRHIPSLDIIKGATAEISKGDNFDHTNVQDLAQENIAQEDSHTRLTETLEEMSSGPASLQLATAFDTDENQVLATGLPSAQFCEENGKRNEEHNCHLREFSTTGTEIAKSQNVSGELSIELQASTWKMDKIIPTDRNEFVHVQHQGIGGLASGSGQGEVSMKEWEKSHLGIVYVEFCTEESACRAAHALHGRLFDGHKVAVCYSPLQLYQTRFYKSFGSPTF